MSGPAARLLRVAINVPDLDAATGFYCGALGFQPIGVPERDDILSGLAGQAVTRRRLRLGAQELELSCFARPGQPVFRGTSSDLRFQHIAIVVRDMQAAHARLADWSVQPISQDGPQRLPAAAGGVTAFKFRDPDGHPLELIHFPEGSAPAAWRDPPGDALHLGYDHSAISVADADRSIAHYAQRYGLTVTARQLNHGPAQERLDALAGVRVEVVALDPAGSPTPHLELLCYRQPRPALDGPEPRPDDLAATRLVLAAAASDPVLESDPDGHFSLVLPG